MQDCKYSVPQIFITWILHHLHVISNLASEDNQKVKMENLINLIPHFKFKQLRSDTTNVYQSPL